MIAINSISNSTNSFRSSPAIAVVALDIGIGSISILSPRFDSRLMHINFSNCERKRAREKISERKECKSVVFGVAQRIMMSCCN